MEWTRIGGLALLGVVTLLLLRPYKPEWAPFIRIAVTIVSMGIILSMASTVISYVTELATGTGALDSETWGLLVKALGIAFLTETAASICRDSGESSLAVWVEMAGKLEILLLAFPFIRMILDTVAQILGGGS